MSTKQQPKQQKGENFYPYLSVDPKNKPQHHPQIPNSESLDFLNIKFDTKRQLRETYIKNFKNKLAVKLFRESTQSLEDIINENHPASVKKKTMNPEELIRTSELKNIKEAIFFPQHKVSSNRHRPPIYLSEQKRLPDTNSLPRSKCFTFNQLATEELKTAKPKKQIFQKMLKKVDQLRQIYKYQTELISITQMNDHVPIRFHTQPITVQIISKDPEVKTMKRTKPKAYLMPNKYSQQIRESDKQYSAALPTSENKTLEVRKYRNQTSIKKRMQFLLRRQLMKQEFKFCEQKHIKSKTETNPPRTKDKDAVGPWDIEQSLHFLKEY